MSKKSLLILLLVVVVLLLVGYGYKQSKESTPEPAETMMKENMNTPKAEMMEEAEEQEMMKGYMDITPAEAKKMIDEKPDLIVVDVSPKYAEGHLPGAVNYYVGDGSLDRAIPNLDKEAEYLVYCHVDSASILGAQKLVEAGFKKVYRMEGNYSAWVAAGYPIEK